MKVLLLLSSLPLVVHGHGCPAFNLVDNTIRDEILGLEDKFFPPSLKTIIEKYPIVNGTNTTDTVTGVYDCHEEDGKNEVGVAAVCEPGEDGECTCVALYNFQECKSCSLDDCYDDDDEIAASTRKNITNKSFTADCSNVKGGLTEDCQVGCKFDTKGCLAPSNATTTTTNVTTPAGPSPPKGSGGDNGGTTPVTSPTTGGGGTAPAPTASAAAPTTATMRRLVLSLVVVVGTAVGMF
jgi:hypothetical protein